MKAIIRVFISSIIFCFLSISVHAIPMDQVKDINIYKQWVIGATPNAKGYLYAKNSWKGSTAHNYNIKGTVLRKFLQYEKQGSLGGINLGWTNNASAKTGKKRARWYFTRSSKTTKPIVYGEPLAIAWHKSGYIKYGQRNNGINLKWSKKPIYEWVIIGGKKGSPVLKGKDKIIIYNTKHKEPLIHYKRKYAGNIGWPDSCGLVGCAKKKATKTVTKTAKKVYGAGKDVYRKFEPKSKKLERFNKRRKSCQKKKDKCTNCLAPKKDVDLDRDSVPDLLEYNLAHKFFPKVMLYGKKYDLEQAYLYKNYSSPFIVREIRGGQCKSKNQCLELRIGITFLYDAGDNKDYANWLGHIGDSEMYTAVVKRTESWEQSKNNANKWEMIRDFSSAHWGTVSDTSVMKSYPTGRRERVTLHAAEMKHALYHSRKACERGVGYQDSCPGKSYDLSQYKGRKLQNIGDQNQHARMDTTIEHPVCGVHHVWSNKKFGEDSKTSDYFNKKISYKLESKVAVLGGVNLTPWCKSKFGSRFKAKLVGKTAGDWVCEGSNGKRNGIAVTAACKQQYGKKSIEAKAMKWNDPYSWKCLSIN